MVVAVGFLLGDAVDVALVEEPFHSLGIPSNIDAVSSRLILRSFVRISLQEGRFEGSTDNSMRMSIFSSFGISDVMLGLFNASAYSAGSFL